MGRCIPNTKLYKECPKCGSWSFNQYDVYCSRCATPLKDSDEWLASIKDYAKSLLVCYLEQNPDLAMQACFDDIPDNATEYIRCNGNVMFNQAATRRVLAECWNEVEIAIDDWKETTGTEVPVSNIEQLHVFAVSQHADMVWREMRELDYGHLDEGTIEEAIHRLKHWN
jgi:ribosomal protein L37E